MKNNLCVQTAMCVTAGSIMQGLLLAQRSVDNKINAIRGRSQTTFKRGGE